jgi:hypothetical protein
MKMDMNAQSLKWNQVISSNTFYEVKLNHFYEYVDGSADNERFFEVYPEEESEGGGWSKMRRNYILGVGTFESLAGSPREWARSKAHTYSLNAALTSQIDIHNQIKTGVQLNSYDIDYQEIMVLFQSGPRHTNWRNFYTGNPLDGAVYLQDKIEYRGMIVNAGLRLDFFNAQYDAPTYIYDPFSSGINSPGHDPNDPDGVFPGFDAIPKEKTPWRVALAPRLGISHPITDVTILHFSYGHFNKRPGWHKFFSYNYRWRDLYEAPVAHESAVEKEPSHGLVGNGLLTFERLIEYEVGIDQEIASRVRLDATIYYKEAKNLTSQGIYTITDGSITGAGNGRNRTWTQVRGTAPPANYGANYTTNIGHYDARGFEIGLSNRLSNNLQITLNYDRSWSIAGRVGWSNLYEPAALEQGARNSRYGADDADQRWNPNDKFKAVANLFLPRNYGPSWGSVKPLGDWNINMYFEWWSGDLYTYHFPEDPSTEPLNRRWEAHTRTNLRLVKGLNFIKPFRTELGIEVRNLFNNKDLNRPGGQDLENYLKTGDLWNDSTSGEPDEWGWYNMNTNEPRQIYVLLNFDF